jgi:hypothetical protein
MIKKYAKENIFLSPNFYLLLSQLYVVLVLCDSLETFWPPAKTALEFDPTLAKNKPEIGRETGQRWSLHHPEIRTKSSQKWP